MLIIQGVFRSGTTTLFRALRNDLGLQCYYEPLHPNLLDHVEESTEDHPSHSKSSLYSEFASLDDSLESLYDPTFALHYAAMGSQDQAQGLQAYLRALADSEPSVVLQFNRGFWMAHWLRFQYPDSAFVHLVRDPRSVVWSQLTTASGDRVRMDWPLLGRRFLSLSSGNLQNVFSPYAYLGAYHINDYLTAGRQLNRTFRDEISTWAQERLRAVQNAPPFVQALTLWGAQVRVCHQHAQNAFGDRYKLIRYEDLCRHPLHTLDQVYENFTYRVPDSVREYGESSIHANQLASWETVPGAKARFRKGIYQAGIEPVLREVGYASDDILSSD